MARRNDDYISLQDAAKAIRKSLIRFPEDYLSIAFADGMIDLLKQLPRYHDPDHEAHYERESYYKDDAEVYGVWKCSGCGCYFENAIKRPTYKFCPDCGRRMIGA